MYNVQGRRKRGGYSGKKKGKQTEDYSRLRPLIMQQIRKRKQTREEGKQTERFFRIWTTNYATNHVLGYRTASG
jgi:hypothetical protein